jgi:hypothetical protein
MRSLNLQNRIAELLTIFVTQIKSHTAMGRTDINRVAESVLIPILKEVYGYQSLKNLNDSNGINNYPAGSISKLQKYINLARIRDCHIHRSYDTRR